MNFPFRILAFISILSANIAVGVFLFSLLDLEDSIVEFSEFTGGSRTVEELGISMESVADSLKNTMAKTKMGLGFLVISVFAGSVAFLVPRSKKRTPGQTRAS